MDKGLEWEGFLAGIVLLLGNWVLSVECWLFNT
jgi:hypothetical protein